MTDTMEDSKERSKMIHKDLLPSSRAATTIPMYAAPKLREKQKIWDRNSEW